LFIISFVYLVFDLDRPDIKIEVHLTIEHIHKFFFVADKQNTKQQNKNQFQRENINR
jgi:hypothetical protein